MPNGVGRSGRRASRLRTPTIATASVLQPRTACCLPGSAHQPPAIPSPLNRAHSLLPTPIQSPHTHHNNKTVGTWTAQTAGPWASFSSVPLRVWCVCHVCGVALPRFHDLGNASRSETPPSQGPEAQVRTVCAAHSRPPFRPPSTAGPAQIILPVLLARPLITAICG